MIHVTCVVDNKTGADSGLKTEHGLAIHIETPSGKILFDTGLSGNVLLHNAAKLGIDLSDVDALVLSHAHYDHSGGLGAVFEHSWQKLPLFAHPDIFRPRYSMRGEQRVSIGMRYTRVDVERHVVLRLSTAPEEVLPGIWTTGEITERADFKGSSPAHFIYKDEVWKPDPYRDDLSIVIEAREGLVVLCGCCHAGLLNTLEHVRMNFQRKITAVLGGLHLVSVSNEELQRAVLQLEEVYAVPELYPNHCTGDPAIQVLFETFGAHVHAFSAGVVASFVSP